MYCPLCIQEVNDNFQVRPSEDLRLVITTEKPFKVSKTSVGIVVLENLDFPVSCRISVSQHSQFRKRCNAFFIDLVSSMCFKDNSPPDSNIILHLLSFLMVEVKSCLVSKEGKGSCPVQSVLKLKDCYNLFEFHVLCFGQATNKLLQRCCLLLMTLWIKIQWFAPWCSNFFWSTGEILSFSKSQHQPSGSYLGLLNSFHPYSFNKVKKYLQQHLSSVEQSNILEKTDKTELYLLYINCLEVRMDFVSTGYMACVSQQFSSCNVLHWFLHFKDSMYERVQFRTVPERQVLLQEETAFLVDYEQSQSAETTTVEYLQQVARVRMDLDLAACLIVENRKDAGMDFWPHIGQLNMTHIHTEWLNPIEFPCMFFLFSKIQKLKRQKRIEEGPMLSWRVLWTCVSVLEMTGIESTWSARSVANMGLTLSWNFCKRTKSAGCSLKRFSLRLSYSQWDFYLRPVSFGTWLYNVLDFHFIQSEDVSPVDQYLACGENYKTIRDAVAKVVVEGHAGQLDKTCEVNTLVRFTPTLLTPAFCPKFDINLQSAFLYMTPPLPSPHYDIHVSIKQ